MKACRSSCALVGLLPLFALTSAFSTSTATAGAFDAQGFKKASADEVDPKVNADPPAGMRKSIALMASSGTRTNALSKWLNDNAEFLSVCSFVAPGEVARSLKSQLKIRQSLPVQIVALADTEQGGDMLLAQQVLVGTVDGAIFFKDPLDASVADLTMMLRACNIAQIPLALNEATADIALRGFARGRKAYLIFNPVAGHGNPEEELDIIRNMLGTKLDLTVVITERDVDPADQARDLIKLIKARPVDEFHTPGMIVASGGDGTVSAIAGATIGSDVPFGIIPRGTANAFSVALGIPTDVPGACSNILAGHVRVVDGARCNDIPMILLAGIGFEAGMVDNAARELKDRLGPLAYVLGAAKQLFDQELFKVKLEIDGQTSQQLEVGAITVANAAPPTSVLAQGFGEVNPCDGMLDVTIATAPNLLQGLDALASLAASAVVKMPTNTDNLLCLRAKTLTVKCEPKQKIVIDGEMMEMDPVTFTVLPGALRVIAPPLFTTS